MSAAIVYSLIAGVAGTLGGGALAAFLWRGGEKTIALLMSFAAGFMLAIVCFDLIPESLAGGGNLISTILSLLVGMVTVMLIGAIADDASLKAKSKRQTGGGAMYKTGLLLTAAIAIHNFPEGLAIGASSVTAQSGLMVSILILVHNIPEGLAMTAPLIGSGMKTPKALLCAALSGAPTVLGAILGNLLTSISPLIVSLCLALAGGAMLYIIFAEMLPAACHAGNEKTAGFTVALSLTAGFILVTLL